MNGLLECLSYQISVSINNCLLFREIKKDKEILEKFYEKYKLPGDKIRKTGELKRKIKELEEKLKEKEEKI